MTSDDSAAPFSESFRLSIPFRMTAGASEFSKDFLRLSRSMDSVHSEISEGLFPLNSVPEGIDIFGFFP